MLFLWIAAPSFLWLAMTSYLGLSLFVIARSGIGRARRARQSRAQCPCEGKPRFPERPISRRGFSSRSNLLFTWLTPVFTSVLAPRAGFTSFTRRPSVSLFTVCRLGFQSSNNLHPSLWKKICSKQCVN